MPGTLSLRDLTEDLKRSVHDTGDFFRAPADADWHRVLQIALQAMQVKRPRTLLGTVTLVAGEVRVPITQTDFFAYKTHVWGTVPPRPWEPCYPGPLPRIAAVQEGGSWALMFDPAPSAMHLQVYGSAFKFWYFARHSLGEEAGDTTLTPADRPLLLLRAQAELMRELSMRNVNKPVQVRDGITGTPRNSTPAAMYQALLKEFEDAR